jgi:hypothetical protein
VILSSLISFFLAGDKAKKKGFTIVTVAAGAYVPLSPLIAISLLLI